MAKVLYLEDDVDLGEVTAQFLTAKNLSVEWVTSGDEALDRLRLYQYDAAVLDWNVQGIDGVTVCNRYRNSGGQIPILMLTGRLQLSEKVQGFDAGADDYLCKPFAAEELYLRLRALLKRPQTLIEDILQVGEIRLDLKSCQVSRGSEVLHLMLKEYQVLEFMMREPKRVFSAQELLDKLWSSESDSTEQAVRKCLTRLRAKLNGEPQAIEDPAKGYVITVKGLGYKLQI
jgi:DNA-binding response OmpR family regulator